MWPLMLILAVLFGVWLGEKKAPIQTWIISVIAVLLLGWLSSIIIPAVLPTLAVGTTQLYDLIILDVFGHIIGFIAVEIKEAVIKPK